MDNALHIDTSTAPVPKKTKRTAYVIVCLLIIGVIFLGLILFTQNKTKKTLLDGYAKKVSFGLYYPQVLPTDYTVDVSSIKIDEGIVFFTMKKNDDTITVSEQARPSIPPDFKRLQETLDFKKIDIPTGEAYYGLNSNKPIVIYLTNTSLITVNSTPQVPSDVLIDLVKNMRSI